MFTFRGENKSQITSILSFCTHRNRNQKHVVFFTPTINRSKVQYCQICHEVAEYYGYGCDKVFCNYHSYERRRALYVKSDWLFVDHSDFIDTLNNIISVTQNDHSSKNMSINRKNL